MPISQNRMIALINSGLDYKAAYESTRAAIEQHFAAANEEEEDWAIALHTVWEHTKPSIVVQSTNSAVVLAVECQHFKQFRNRNNYAAKEARKYRDKLAARVASEAAGITPNEGPAQLNTPAAKAAQRASIQAKRKLNHGFAQSTDEDQVQADSDLALGETDKASVLGFFDGLDENGNKINRD